MNVLLIGHNVFADALSAFFQRLGHSVNNIPAASFLENPAAGDETDYLIEAEPSSVALKQLVIHALPRGKPILSLVTNACTTLVASWARTPGTVAGCVWVPPLSATMPVVELARAMQTNDESFTAAQQFWAGLGCSATVVEDGPGLVRMRILCCVINEAITARADGVATASDIDLAMRLGTNYPQGPLAWGRALGLDVVLATMQALFDEFGEDRYRPCPLLKRLVLSGQTI